MKNGLSLSLDGANLVFRHRKTSISAGTIRLFRYGKTFVYSSTDTDYFVMKIHLSISADGAIRRFR